MLRYLFFFRKSEWLSWKILTIETCNQATILDWFNSNKIQFLLPWFITVGKATQWFSPIMKMMVVLAEIYWMWLTRSMLNVVHPFIFFFSFNSNNQTLRYSPYLLFVEEVYDVSGMAKLLHGETWSQDWPGEPVLLLPAGTVSHHW